MNRTRTFVKVSIINYAFRILGMILGFISIPITLSYLGDERFGVWQTLLSIISWATLANFGIGNGLRNKITELLAKNEISKIKSNISSAYIVIFKISLFIMIALLYLLYTIDPDEIFKNLSITNLEIKLTFLIIIFNFCMNFVIGLCNSIAFGLHKSHYTTIQQTLTSFITLILIYILDGTMESSIIYMALVHTMVSTTGNIILSIIIFTSEKQLVPTFKYEKTEVDKNMYSIGFKFFFLQLGSMVLITTDNFLITKLIGAQDVTYYSIVYKLFFTVYTLYTILLIPLWNSSADAYQRREFQWIYNAMKKLLLTLIPVSILLIICVFLFDEITNIWIGRTNVIDQKVVLLMGIYVFLLCFNGIFIYIQNGIGKVKTQLISVILAVIINIPCTIIFVNYFDLSISGIVLANILSQLIILMFCPIDVIFKLKKHIREAS